MRIGVLQAWIDQVQDASLRARIEESLRALEAEGATLTRVEWPSAAHAIAAYYVIAAAEASTNLSRYDGIRFGMAGRGASLRERIRDARVRGFGPEVKRRIVLGTFVLSAGYYDAHYGKAVRVRARIAAEVNALLTQLDALVGPVTPELPFELGARTGDVMAMYRSDLFTLPASLAGIPAASVPLGLVGALPAAMQIMTRRWNEAALFSLSAAVERAFPVALPPLAR
jgi:aspartyl-tRNA(Asn)/glutamyl-tRNA(Gln) amidotransferase subunit A